MTSTKTYTFRPGYSGPLRHAFAETGAPFRLNHNYPSFHESGNEGYIVIHSVLVDDGLVQVVSDGCNHEWMWVKENGEVIYTKSGWGCVAYALRDALNYAMGGSLPAMPDMSAAVLDAADLLERVGGVSALRSALAKVGSPRVSRCSAAQLTKLIPLLAEAKSRLSTHLKS